MNYLLAVASALLLILAFPRFNIAMLAPVALAPLLFALAREGRHSRRFLLGYIAGIIYWFGACYWIQAVLHDHGGMSVAGSWGAFALFFLAKAVHMGVFALLAGMVIRRGWAIAAIPAIWVAIERTHAPLGFAWLALGNAGSDMGLPMRLAPFAGVYGLSFVFAMIATAVALILLRRPRRELVPVAALLLLYALPKLPEPAQATEPAVLVQPNVSGDAEWTPDWADQIHKRLEALTLRAAFDPAAPYPKLIVWPEIPAPVYFDEDARFRERVQRIARTTRAYVLINAVAHTPQGAPLNSALLVSPTGQALGRYDKMYLVPFGEFVPAPFKFLVAKISTEAGDFAEGAKLITLPAGQHKIGAFVCYESVFPHLVRQFANDGAELLVNISNDGWYGHSSARDQHLRIARMRAAENRRWLLRATNDGITSTIDPAGRVTTHLPSFVEGSVRTGYSWIYSKTVYTRYGDWFVWVCAVLAAGSLLISFIPQYRPEKDMAANGRE